MINLSTLIKWQNKSNENPKCFVILQFYLLAIFFGEKWFCNGRCFWGKVWIRCLANFCKTHSQAMHSFPQNKKPKKLPQNLLDPWDYGCSCSWNWLVHIGPPIGCWGGLLGQLSAKGTKTEATLKLGPRGFGVISLSRKQVYDLGKFLYFCHIKTGWLLI